MQRLMLWGGLSGILILAILVLAYPFYSHVFPTQYEDLDGDWKQQGREEWLYITEGQWYSAYPTSNDALMYPHGTLVLEDDSWVFRDNNGQIISSSVNEDATELVLNGSTYGRIER